MATINPTVTTNSDFTVNIYTYTGLATGDDGAPIPTATFADRTVQITGTVGTAPAGTLLIEGSNDGTTYATLTQADDTAADLTAPGDIVTITENPLYIRPRVSAGDGTTDIDVIFACRRPTDKRQ